MVVTWGTWAQVNVGLRLTVGPGPAFPPGPRALRQAWPLRLLPVSWSQDSVSERLGEPGPDPERQLRWFWAQTWSWDGLPSRPGSAAPASESSRLGVTVASAQRVASTTENSTWGLVSDLLGTAACVYYLTKQAG